MSSNDEANHLYELIVIFLEKKLLPDQSPSDQAGVRGTGSEKLTVGN
jgi:hypothetical protein